MAEPAPLLDAGELVSLHYADVYRYAYWLSGSAHDAEDLAQQTYLVVQRHADQLRSPDTVRGWLLAICRNSYLKSVRRRRPVSAGSLDLDLNHVVQPPTDAALRFEPEQLRGALDELPEDYRMVLLLFYFEQLSYKQIAAALELPAGTVMSRLSRGKAHLRKRLTASEVPAVSPLAAVAEEARPGALGIGQPASQGSTR